MRIAVLVSGQGSNLQALIDAKLSGDIVGVISNKATAYALQRAEHAGIATAVIAHKDYPSRESFDAVMHQQLLDWKVDLVILAGFMRILSAEFVAAWHGKMINIHPSLLPYYKGMHTHQRVLQCGDVFHGCTVHYVTAELDAGPALAQCVLKVGIHDDAESLAQRVHDLEHFIYPLAVEWICTQVMVHQADGSLTYRGKALAKPLQFSHL
ncbi:phosphoribosylglycinamide formyltransferase-1 [Acinetobacter calcoaceticus]|uniref:Phosphoribosylglycinamide formyltransferase n=1 Tax=Acinetobacter calcoaceticus TaxID=471 RepID=A0A4R1XVM2_ACICA|nr:phosphoribosylglycinamide formyltransferase-1 [Acinetobacter calcoaceticus]